jgi:endothelin-converting enzyme/putative endopeptidase
LTPPGVRQFFSQQNTRMKLLPSILCSTFLLGGAALSARATGVDDAAMNRAVRPGDDFFAYANGSWVKATEIPADRGNWSNSAALGEANARRIADLLEAAAKHRATATPVERLAADAYTAFLDEPAIEARGLAPVQPLLRRVAALGDKAALARELGARLRADVDPINATNYFTENILGLWVAQGLEDPDHYHPYLLQGGLGLPDRAYYLTANPHLEEVRGKYRAYIAELLRLAGQPEPEQRAARIFALELRLAEAHAAREDSEDIQKCKTVWARAEFPAQAPGLDWASFWAGSGLEKPAAINVWHPGAVRGVSALVASEPLAVWQDYLVFHTLNHFANYLPRAFADAHFRFYETTLAGTPQQQDRWKRALTAANAEVGEAVGQLYVAKYFPPSSKAQVQAMVANIVAAFDRRIGRLGWMNPATKEQARAKLKTLYVGIGYPEKWTDYTGLVIDPADAVGNLVRAEEFNYRQAVARLDQPVDPKAWCMTPQLVNAVNMPLQNALNFPAAILQPPYFDPAAPAAVNYGAIGATIGHEISHSFDDQGAQFDAQGRLRDWWTPEDLAHFKAASAVLAAQYSAYRPFPDLAVNGQQTLSENLADLAGLTAAFEAWQAATAGQPGAKDATLTGPQQFFIAYAQSWRIKMRDATLRQRILADGHAPSQYRALTVRNLDSWYEAFGVQPDQALYLAPAARVRVW